jgi:mRNA interferase HicA
VGRSQSPCGRVQRFAGFDVKERGTSLFKGIHNRYVGAVNSGQAKRFLAQRGCTFEPGKGGHLLVRRGERTSVLPQHGGRKELGKGLWLKILRDLDIKE